MMINFAFIQVMFRRLLGFLRSVNEQVSYSIATFLFFLILAFIIQLYILALRTLRSTLNFHSRIGALSDRLKCSCLLFFPQLGFSHNFESNIFKHVLDIFTCFSTCCIEFKVVLLGKLAALGLIYLLVW